MPRSSGTAHPGNTQNPKNQLTRRAARQWARIHQNAGFAPLSAVPLAGCTGERAAGGSGSPRAYPFPSPGLVLYRCETGFCPHSDSPLNSFLPEAQSLAVPEQSEKPSRFCLR